VDQLTDKIMTAVQELVEKILQGYVLLPTLIEEALKKEKNDLEYFFSHNDYNTDFIDFSDQYEYLTLCNNISERRMCDNCSIEFGPCEIHLS